MDKKIVLKIDDNEYSINFPTVGDLIDIEILKSHYSKGKYLSMLGTRTVTSNFALDMIDAVSHFSVLIPSLKEDLKVKSLMDLSIPDSKELVDVYRKEFTPWFNGWLEILRSDVEEEKK